MSKFGWGRENRPIGFDRWNIMLSYLFKKDFDGMNPTELGQMNAIHLRLTQKQRLNSNQDTLLSKNFKRLGGTL